MSSPTSLGGTLEDGTQEPIARREDAKEFEAFNLRCSKTCIPLLTLPGGRVIPDAISSYGDFFSYPDSVSLG